MKEHNFHKSIIVGSEGERLIFDLLQSMSSIETVQDVVNEEEYRKIDVDFVVTTVKGETLYYELKTEPMAARTRNLFFEVVSNDNYGTEGCFMYSQADYWMSFIPQTGELYILNTLKCREYITKRASKFHSLKCVSNGHYNSRGYAIPIVDVLANVPHHICRLKELVDYDYIEEDSANGIKPEFKNVVWKI